MYILKKIDDNDAIGNLLRMGLALYPYKYRKLNKAFKDFSALLFLNEKKSYSEMKAYQWDKVKKLVQNAYEHTEFYNTFYNEKGFNPSDLKTFEDVKKIPVITKQDIKDCYKDLVLQNYNGKILHSVTSGTSGAPLQILRDKDTASKEWASICYQWYRAGYKPTDGRIEFRGVLAKNELYRHIKHEKVLRINILMLNEKNLDKIIAEIVSSKYTFLHGYPSALYIFAKLISKKYEKAPENMNIKGVLLASEIVYDWQVDLLENVFSDSTNIIAHYGQAEKVALGAWNLDKSYHFIPSYSLVEFGAKNQIIGTSFVNDNIPLIRYQLNDIAGDKLDESNSDKMLYPIINRIAGRLEDITFANDGTPIPPAIVTFPFKNLRHIQACRIIQKDYTVFYIEYQKAQQTTQQEIDVELAELKQKFIHIYGVQSTIHFIEKASFENIKNGKFRWIINNIEN